jgi:ribosomal protein S18 acetylase RimI-like enzyme
VLGDAPYADSLRASLESAMRSASDEHRAIVAHDGDMLVGLAVFGETAGALGAGRIHLVAVDPSARRNGLGMALTQAACADLRARRARFVVIELPEEPRLESALRLARRAGFYQEGRVRDYVRDGVGLLVLRRDLGDS